MEYKFKVGDYVKISKIRSYTSSAYESFVGKYAFIIDYAAHYNQTEKCYRLSIDNMCFNWFEDELELASNSFVENEQNLTKMAKLIKHVKIDQDFIKQTLENMDNSGIVFQDVVDDDILDNLKQNLEKMNKSGVAILNVGHHYCFLGEEVKPIITKQLDKTVFIEEKDKIYKKINELILKSYWLNEEKNKIHKTPYKVWNGEYDILKLKIVEINSEIDCLFEEQNRLKDIINE